MLWVQIQPHWAICDGSQHTCIETTYLIISLMFLLCIFIWSSSLSLFPDFSFYSLVRQQKIIITFSPLSLVLTILRNI